MPDTQTGQDISPDTPYPRITLAALERAMARSGCHQVEDLAEQLGFKRQTFWRARRGQYNIRLIEAMRIARAAGWRIERCFEGGINV